MIRLKAIVTDEKVLAYFDWTHIANTKTLACFTQQSVARILACLLFKLRLESPRFSFKQSLCKGVFTDKGFQKIISSPPVVVPEHLDVTFPDTSILASGSLDLSISKPVVTILLVF